MLVLAVGLAIVLCVETDVFAAVFPPAEAVVCVAGGAM
jgi:hypothetical protein